MPRSDDPRTEPTPPAAPEGGSGRAPAVEEAGPEASRAARGRQAGESHAMGIGRQQPLGAIGPERLRELRERIRNGTYPQDRHVVGGLLRLMRTPEDGPDDR